MSSNLMINSDFNEIIGDNISSSKELALKITGFFKRYSSAENELLMDIGDKFYSHFIGMGIVRNTILELQESISHGSDIEALSDAIQERIDKQAAMATENIAELFKEKISLVTISRSSQVEDSILKHRENINHVYVLESRPMLEGASLYRKLSESGIKTTLLTDASMNIACRKADLALVGCDSLLGDGTLIHKTGTLPLFVLMHFHTKKNYVIGTSMKEEKQYSIDNYPEFRNNDCAELGISDGDCINQYFELIPRQLMDGLYNEKGFTDFSRL